MVAMTTPSSVAGSRSSSGALRLCDDAATIASCRVCVVGGGLAGLELAAELERRGVEDAVVLEAGPGRDLLHVNGAFDAARALRTWLEPRSDAHFERPWTSATPPHYAGASGMRMRLGGRSLYWHGVALPVDDWALGAPWPARVVADLRESRDGGPGLYELVCDDLARWARGGGGPLLDGSRTVRIGELVLGATPRAVRRSAAHPERWIAYSPLDRWRHPDSDRALREPGVAIVTGAVVDGVVVEGGRARGVRGRAGARGVPFEIAAEQVVLAAGTVPSSGLALGALRAATGRERRLTGLVDHIVHGVVARVEGAAARRLLELAPPGSYCAPRPQLRSIAFLDVRATARGALLDLQLSGEQTGGTHGAVALRSGRPVVSAALSAGDRELVAGQRRALRALWDDLAAAGACRAAALEFPDYDAARRGNAVVLPERLATVAAGAPLTWCNSLGTEDHEGGTLPLGALLDDDHQLVDVPGLYAAGPATFPRMGAANPALTVLALARRLGARLAGAPRRVAAAPGARR